MNVAAVDCRPRQGQIVRVLRGRDAGQFAVVISFEEPHFVFLADGDQRKFDHPKKKNVKHIQLINYVSEDVAEALRQHGRVTNAKLRYALNQYLLLCEQKGE
ncbi:KOW domain-containing RNA-binding protein [Laceyella tengchongensis]|uniref:KOW domain-containing RNA-binding protein n=1 Tax=Laceyella tengchongensis TaxID=574699 RepID=UPI0012B95BA3|nr:RNA-binding protein [Laceyella tengchongensis]